MKFRIKKYVYSGMFLAVLLLSHSAQDVYGKKKNLPPVLPPAKPSFPATEITIPMVEFPKYPETGKLELLASPRKMITTDFTSREINHIGVGDAARFQDSDTEIIDLSLIQEGDYAFPLPGAKVISPYGGRRRHHSGYDIKTCPNDTIVAAFDGVVRLSKPYAAYGNVIVIRHYNGLETVYSHNSKNLVKPGDYVKAGQPIALTGRTGRATTEHLHFEVRVNGQHFNPNLVFDLQERKLNNQCLVFTQKGGKIAVKPVELMPHQFAGDYSYSPASCKNKEQIESKKETL